MTKLPKTDDAPQLTKETAEALADDLEDAKNQLVKLGRRVFQLSSRVASVRHEDPSFFDCLPDNHPIFGNETIGEVQLGEFYKASEGYVTLLREVNIQLLKLSGRLNKQ